MELELVVALELELVRRRRCWVGLREVSLEVGEVGREVGVGQGPEADLGHVLRVELDLHLCELPGSQTELASGVYLQRMSLA